MGWRGESRHTQAEIGWQLVFKTSARDQERQRIKSAIDIGKSGYLLIDHANGCVIDLTFQQLAPHSHFAVGNCRRITFQHFKLRLLADAREPDIEGLRADA